jgi:hypothetical protein
MMATNVLTISVIILLDATESLMSVMTEMLALMIAVTAMKDAQLLLTSVKIIMLVPITSVILKLDVIS